MKLTITIEMDNDAFRYRTSEVRRILGELRDKMRSEVIETGLEIKLRDSNGNTVGKAEVTA